MLAEILTLLLSPVTHLLRRRSRRSHIAAFYRSWEWKQLRYQALQRYGRICSCCRTTDGKMVVDHIKPLRSHWSLRLSIGNLQVLCNSCNMGKGSRDHTDWR